MSMEGGRSLLLGLLSHRVGELKKPRFSHFMLISQYLALEMNDQADV